MFHSLLQVYLTGGHADLGYQLFTLWWIVAETWCLQMAPRQRRTATKSTSWRRTAGSRRSAGTRPREWRARQASIFRRGSNSNHWITYSLRKIYSTAETLWIDYTKTPQLATNINMVEIPKLKYLMGHPVNAQLSRRTRAGNWIPDNHFAVERRGLPVPRLMMCFF